MIKILFVDDDAIARRSIGNRIDWTTHGWELCHTAKDGVEALDYMREHQPDVILSDIKMPVMDGIQMAIIAKDYYPNVKFIFLSGYKDFEYAKQALNLNAVDYLTKPILAENLIGALEKAEKLLHSDYKINKLLNEGYPLIKRHYISKLMYNNFLEADDATFKAFDINLDQGLGITAFIDLKFNNEEPPKDLDIQLQPLCTELGEEHPGSFFLPLEDGQIFLIYTASNTPSKDIFYEKVNYLQENISCRLNQRFQCSSIFLYGTIFNTLNQMYLSYQAAQNERGNQISNLLREVKHYIETHYQQSSITLLQTARQFHISHCYLTSLYKDKYGINLYDYLIQVRMEKASELLKNTSLKSYEIAERVGYNNSQYFSISFKKYYNCTVTEYRAAASLSDVRIK